MKRVFSFLGSIIILLSGFHIYLNIANDENISYEESVKIVKEEFILSPIKNTLYLLVLIFLSLIVGYLIGKLYNYLNYIENKRDFYVLKSISEYSKREEIREKLFEKLISKEISFLKSRKMPWSRINVDFSEIIVRDICDNKFPNIGNWYKLQTFNLTNEGIEFFDLSNIVGFRIYFDKKNNWDVLHYGDVLKKGTNLKKSKGYCAAFIPYENILHIEWQKDEYYALITLFCLFKYKANVKHPFKEFRYYIEDDNFLDLLDNKKRKNFKPIIFRLYRYISRPFRIISNTLKHRKYRR